MAITGRAGTQCRRLADDRCFGHSVAEALQDRPSGLRHKFLPRPLIGPAESLFPRLIKKKNHLAVEKENIYNERTILISYKSLLEINIYTLNIYLSLTRSGEWCGSILRSFHSYPIQSRIRIRDHHSYSLSKLHTRLVGRCKELG